MRVTGVVEKIIYQTGESNYKVARVEIDDEIFTVSGDMPSLIEKGIYEFDVTEKDHPKYGFQLVCNSLKIPATAGEDDIIRFLSSGAFSGIGKVTAKRIVEHFGEATLDILKKDVNKLEEVDGIGHKTLSKIKESIKEHMEKSDAFFELSKYGFNLAQSKKIYHQYEERASDVLEENPYSILRDVDGLTFAKVDDIALKRGFKKTSLERMTALLFFELSRICYTDGHTFVDKNQLIQSVIEREKFSFESEDIKNDFFDKVLLELMASGDIHVDRVDSEDETSPLRIFIREIYECEVAICENLFRLNENTIIRKSVEELAPDIVLSDDQKSALDKAFDEAVYILTGAAGSGKTTILKEMIKRADMAGFSYKLAAPTGRAAARMTELTGVDATTIHRLLEVKYDENASRIYFSRNKSVPLDEDVIFIDEASMIDIVLFKHLVSAIKSGANLVLIGDPNQLPPVGIGLCFLDMISSGKFNASQLTGVHRQKEASCIISNARAVLDLQPLQYNKDGGDFYLFKTRNDYETLTRVLELATKRVPEKFGYDPYKSIVVLSPKKKGLLGTENLNLKLQQLLNPNHKQKFFDKFAVGDKVMQIKNNYNLKWTDPVSKKEDEGVFNGEMGVVIEAEQGEIVVDFNGEKITTYTEKTIRELELAYAMTVHKSQGNEFEVVIMPSYDMGRFMESNNLIYTAITRAKKMFVLAGNQMYFERAYKNDNKNARNTNLANLICAGL